MINQAWFQVFGLILDFLGVSLIAAEWLLAQRQEAIQRGITETAARRAASMEFIESARISPDPTMQRHNEMMRASTRRATDAQQAQVRTRYGGMRVKTVAAGLVLVGLGFLFQLAAAWPGCCRAIGIIPFG